jgi:predicted anti-sigma-YlaC factor YlaD
MKKNCVDCQIIISASFDGEAEPSEKQRMFRHLTDCDDCRQFWDSVEDVKLLSVSQQRMIASPMLDSRIMSVSESARQLSTRIFEAETIFRKWQTRFSLSYGFAAFVLIAAFAIGSLVTSIQHTFSDRSNISDSEKIYVSVLPNVLVIGHSQDQSN